jgi:negative regulator of sigma E activity
VILLSTTEKKVKAGANLVTNPNHGSKGLGIIGELPITTL